MPETSTSPLWSVSRLSQAISQKLRTNIRAKGLEDGGLVWLPGLIRRHRLEEVAPHGVVHIADARLHGEGVR